MSLSKADQYIIHNGELHDVTQSGLNPKNRGFLFGDGLFESIKIINGQPLFVSVHFSRLSEGVKALKINFFEGLTCERLEREILELIKKCEVKGGGRARVTLYRNHGGFYLPTDNGSSYVISIINDEGNAFELNQEGLVVNLYTEVKKQITPLSHFKTINSLNYIMASIYARNAGLDDALLVNENDHIIESTNSNLFIVSNGVLYTPSLADGCVGGTMRMQIINLALENNIKVYEYSLTPQNLLAADEMFLTNAIQGVKWVSGYRMKRYFHKMSKLLIEKLNQKAHEVTS